MRDMEKWVRGDVSRGVHSKRRPVKISITWLKLVNLGVYETPEQMESPSRRETWRSECVVCPLGNLACQNLHCVRIISKRRSRRFTRDVGGYSFLYADLFMNEEEFEQMFDLTLYKKVRWLIFAACSLIFDFCCSLIDLWSLIFAGSQAVPLRWRLPHALREGKYYLHNCFFF